MTGPFAPPPAWNVQGFDVDPALPSKYRSATDFITRAYRLLNLIDITLTPAPEDLADSLIILNDMIDACATENLLVVYEAPNQYTLTASTSSYTIGPGATFDQVRPTRLSRWSLVPDTTASPIQELDRGRPANRVEWQRIVSKGLTAQYPAILFYDDQFDVNGYGRILVYPVPTSSKAGIVLYTRNPLGEFPDLTTKILFPPGYRRFITYNLAVELAIDHPGSLTTEVKTAADTSRGWVKRVNKMNAVREAEIDRAIVGARGRGRYDIYTDE